MFFSQLPVNIWLNRRVPHVSVLLETSLWAPVIHGCCNVEGRSIKVVKNQMEKKIQQNEIMHRWRISVKVRGAQGERLNKQ